MIGWLDLLIVILGNTKDERTEEWFLMQVEMNLKDKRKSLSRLWQENYKTNKIKALVHSTKDLMPKDANASIVRSQLDNLMK